MSPDLVGGHRRPRLRRSQDRRGPDRTRRQERGDSPQGQTSKARRTVEHARDFRRLVKWRTGSEGRIAYLKRRYGLDRTLFDGLEGARTWCALAVLAHNTVKITALIEANTLPPPVAPASPRPRPHTPATAPRATGPPGTHRLDEHLI